MKCPELGWLVLGYLFHSNPAKIIKLIEAVDDVRDVFDLTDDEACSILDENAVSVMGTIRRFSEWKKCEDDLRICNQLGIDILGYTDERYPPLLRMIYDPPVMLFVRGRVEILNLRPCVAVVGARKATRDGLMIAKKFAGDLAKAGWTVVSGMAYGVDRAAHEGALEESGSTLAIWGSGPDIVYPKGHHLLAEKIMKNGAALTEFPVGLSPSPYHFPQRNRIISGISLGVVVIEAAESSGSLITARYALEHGRDVCAVPWDVGLVMSHGTNGLIKQGAALVETAHDVIQTLSATNPKPCPVKKSRQVKRDVVTESPPSLRGRCLGDPLLDCIGIGGKTLDEIIAQCGLETPEVMKRMIQLELDGFVEELPGKRYKLRGD